VERLSVGVIVWSEEVQDDPTVLAHRDPVTLARAMALLIHDRIQDTYAFPGLTGFLDDHAPPQDCLESRDVDDWLDELREAAPYPAFSFHDLPITGGTDGTDRAEAGRMLSCACAS
jgi:hypothetical protein